MSTRQHGPFMESVVKNCKDSIEVYVKLLVLVEKGINSHILGEMWKKYSLDIFII